MDLKQYANDVLEIAAEVETGKYLDAARDAVQLGRNLWDDLGGLFRPKNAAGQPAPAGVGCGPEDCSPEDCAAFDAAVGRFKAACAAPRTAAAGPVGSGFDIASLFELFQLLTPILDWIRRHRAPDPAPAPPKA